MVEAKGKLVIPGGIDTHTHLDFFFMGARTSDDYYSGTKAALAGGTTTISKAIFKTKIFQENKKYDLNLFIILTVNYIGENRNVSLLEAYNLSKAKAENKACCDFAFHVIVSHYDEKVAKDIETLAKEKGINSFKVYMAYKEWMINDEEMIKVFKKCKELGAIPLVHAENGNIIDDCIQKIKALGIKKASNLKYPKNTTFYTQHFIPQNETFKLAAITMQT